MGRACSTHRRDEKFMENFSLKNGRGPRRRYDGSIDMDSSQHAVGCGIRCTVDVLS
jgi:hypothetical protein